MHPDYRHLALYIDCRYNEIHLLLIFLHMLQTRGIHNPHIRIQPLNFPLEKHGCGNTAGTDNQNTDFIIAAYSLLQMSAEVHGQISDFTIYDRHLKQIPEVFAYQLCNHINILVLLLYFIDQRVYDLDGKTVVIHGQL